MVRRMVCAVGMFSRRSASGPLMIGVDCYCRCCKLRIRFLLNCVRVSPRAVIRTISTWGFDPCSRSPSSVPH